MFTVHNLMLIVIGLCCAGTQPLWSQCGGINMPGVSCTPNCKDVAYVNCVAGAYCARGNDYYWQCVRGRLCHGVTASYM